MREETYDSPPGQVSGIRVINSSGKEELEQEVVEEVEGLGKDL